MKRNHLLNLTEYWAFRFVLFKFRLLPYRWSNLALQRLFLWLGYGLGIRRDVAEKQLRRVYPDQEPHERRALLRKIYRNLGMTAAEIYLQDESKLIATAQISGRSHVDKAFSLGRGAILATAHFGNWELARILPSLGIPLSVVVKKQHNPLFDNYNNAIRTRHGVSLIDFRRGLRDILAHLAKNEMVAILMDQDAGASGLRLDFLGSPASHWRGVAKLSLRYKIPIVPGLALRTPEGGVKFCFEPMLYHPELEDKEENYAYILNKVNAVLEAYIDRYPEQWFWVHKRWKKSSVSQLEAGI